jgi:hypothetical protein
MKRKEKDEVVVARLHGEGGRDGQVLRIETDGKSLDLQPIVPRMCISHLLLTRNPSILSGRIHALSEHSLSGQHAVPSGNFSLVGVPQYEQGEGGVLPRIICRIVVSYIFPS